MLPAASGKILREENLEQEQAHEQAKWNETELWGQRYSLNLNQMDTQILGSFRMEQLYCCCSQNSK